MLESARARLQTLLKHAVNNIPYYREVAASRSIRLDFNEPADDCLRRFPLLDKAAIRVHSEDLTWKALTSSHIINSSTSGSTGESLFFKFDREAACWRLAGKFRHAQWCGVSPFDKHAMLWGARFDEPASRSLADRLRQVVRPLLFLSSYQLDECAMTEYARQLRDNKAVLLTSYPSPLVRFAEFLKQQKQSLPSLKGIICSAEQLCDYQRALIEEVFRVPVFNRYGCREFGDMAMECAVHRGLHVDAERLWVEVLRPDGGACKPGELGELVITDLANRAMPFIRYRIGDSAAWAANPCSCGRGLPVLARVEGRAFDLVHTPSGGALSGTFWTLLTRHVSKRITNFQVRQSRIGSAVILMVTVDRQPLTTSEEGLLRQKVAEAAPDLSLRIEYAEAVPETRGGKRRFVISELRTSLGPSPQADRPHRPQR